MAGETERVSLQVAIESLAAKHGALEVKKATDIIYDGAKKADKGVSELEKEMVLLRKTTLTLVAPVATLFTGFAAVRGFKATASLIADFERTMVTVAGVAQATNEEMRALEATARKFGASTRFTAVQAGEGLLYLSRAGFSANDSMAALEATLTLAAAGQIDLGTAADFASNIVTQFGLAAKDTARVVDDLVVVANNANTNVEQMAQALSFVGPVANALSITLEETSAAIGALGDSGIQSTRAGRGLRGMMLALAGPTQDAEKVLARLGLTVADVDPSAQKLTSVLEKLRDANIKAGDAAKLFGRENTAAALVLIGAIDAVKELEQAQKDNVGEAQRLADMQDDTLSGAAKTFISVTQEAALSLGDNGLKGAMRSVVDEATDVVRALAGINNESKPLSESAQILAVQIEAVTIALAVMVGARILVATFRLATNLQLMRKAVTGLNVALARNPITIIATAATFAFLEISGMVDALSDTGDELNNLRSDVFDFKNAIDQLEGLEGVVNRAFSIGEPELIKRAFDNVRNVLTAEAEQLSSETGRQLVKLSDLTALIPESIANRIGASTDGIERIASAERAASLKYLEDQKKFLKDQQAQLTGAFDGKKILQLESLIAKVNKQIADLGKESLGTELISRADALKFVEGAINGLNGALEEQQKLIDNATNSPNSGAGVFDPDALAEALEDMQALRDELTKQTALVGKNAAESMQYETQLKAVAASTNVPFIQRIAFMIEINDLTKTLLDAQRDLAASDLINAQRDEIEILTLKNDGHKAEAELLRTTISLREQGITLSQQEKATLLDLIRQRQQLEGSDKKSKVDKLFRELELERELIGLTSDERERAIKLRELESAAIQEQVPNVEGLVAKYKEALEELQRAKEVEQFSQSIKNSLGETLSDIAFQAQTAEDAFKNLFSAVQRLFFERFVSDPLSDALGGLFDGIGNRASNGGGTQPGIFGGLFAKGGAFSQGYQVRLAGGDILTGPTALSTARGPALGGEAGPEAIMPLKRDSQGRLGVSSPGSGGNSGPINITMNFPNATNVAGFEQSAYQAMQQLQRALRR